MKRRKSKWISLGLAMILAIGLMPANVFADTGVIDEVTITFAEPEVGDSIATFIENCDAAVPDGANYSFAQVYVYDKNDEEQTGDFLDKKMYILEFEIILDDGYTIAKDENGECLTKSTVNGKTYGWGYEDEKTYYAYYELPLGLTPIKSLDLDYPTPEIGKTPAELGKGTVIPDPEGSIVETEFVIDWYESDTKDFTSVTTPMASTDTFQEGKYYAPGFAGDWDVIPSEGYMFDDDWYWKVPDAPWISIDSTISFVAIGPLGSLEDNEIECLLITYPEPEIGKTPAELDSAYSTGLPEGSVKKTEFDLIWFECEDDQFAFVTEDTLETAGMLDSDVFKTGYYYAASPVDGVPMNTEDGYYLPADGVPISITNGNSHFPKNDLLWYVCGPLGETVETPTFTPDSTTFTGSIDVAVSCATTGAAIHYTMDGSDPTADSEIMTENVITLTETTTLKVIAVLGYNNSEIAEATYTLDRPNTPSRPSRDHDPVPDPDPEPQTPAEPEPTPAKSTFVDVNEKDYFYDAVEWAVENKITSGVSADKFGPDQDCTRAQVVTFLWLASGSPDAAPESIFDDVDAKAYYEKAVAWAVEQGITAGTAEGEFSPETTVTRAQFITMLWAAKGKPEAEGSAPFGDVAADAYYAKAVAWAYANGITAGKSADLFAPDDPCTRGQIVTFLHGAFGE